MQTKDRYIKQIEVTDFLEAGQNVCLPLFEDVTILAGDNGSGKTILLNIIKSMNYKSAVPKELYGAFSAIKILENGNADAYSRELIAPNNYQYNGDYFSVGHVSSGEIIQDFKCNSLLGLGGRTEEKVFLQVLNVLFSTWDIKIETIKSNYIRLYKKGELLSKNNLSDGQRRLLTIMLAAFSAPHSYSSLLLIDTPETFLHLDITEVVIESIQKINPSVQLLVVTHSPDLISNGLFDKVIQMEDILTKTNNEA